VKFSDFRQITRAVQLDPPTDLAGPLYQAVVKMLRGRVERGGQGVRLLGLSAQQLLHAGAAPPTLFPDEDQARKRSAAAAIDRLRGRFGDNAVTFGRLLEPRAGDTGTPSERMDRLERPERPDGGGQR
jgi:DNA polymerase IV